MPTLPIFAPASRRPRPRRSLGGACAFATAVLCLLAQVAGVAHLAFVSHVRCLDHDALVHTDGGGEAGHRDAGATARPEAAGVPGSAGHADDHCAVAGLRRRHALLPPNDDVATPDAPRSPGAAMAPLATRVLPPAVPLLRLAPKSGPPAAI